MMAQKLGAPMKFTFKRIEKPLNEKSDKATVITNQKDKVQIDEAYKEFFASLFKIKDKDVHRRVIQAVNGQNLTCTNCSIKIEPKGFSGQKKTETPTTFSVATETLAADFEFLDKINSSSKTNGTTTTNNGECVTLNKIHLGRAKRKFEPYAVKTEREMRAIPSDKISYFQCEADSLLVSLVHLLKIRFLIETRLHI